MKVLDRVFGAVGSAIGSFHVAREKAITLGDPDFMKRFPGWGVGDDKLVQEYRQHPYVHAAIRAKARNIAQVPFRLAQGEKIIESGPVFELFQDVNPESSASQLWEACVVAVESKGEIFVIEDESERQGVPIYLWPTYPDFIKPAYRNGIFMGWYQEINGTSRFFERERVIQPKYYNPWDLIRGLAPMEALKLGLQTDWNAIKYNKLFFDQGSMIGNVYSTKGNLKKEQYNRMKDQLIKRRQGVGHAHEDILLEGDTKLDSRAPGNKDMQFVEGRALTKEEVMMVFGVPETELANYKNIPYANTLSADLSFWKKTLMPLMKMLADKFNTDFLSRFGMTGFFDISAIDVLNREILEKAKASKEYFIMGVPFNVINERFHLGFEEFEGWDLPFAGRTMPQTQNLMFPVEEEKLFVEPPKLVGIEGPEEVAKKLRAAKWKSLMAVILPIMVKASKDVRRYFIEAESAILHELLKNVADQWTLKADEVPDLDEFLSDKKLREVLLPHIRDAVKTGGISVAEQFVMGDDQIMAASMRRLKKVLDINETVRQQLKEKLAEAIREGATEAERAELVIKTTKHIMKNAQKRAKTIARTETHGAFNEGRNESMAIAQPPKKQWISSRDAIVRDSHAAVDGEMVAFDSAFSNGLMYPLADGPPEEVINCRCVHVAIFD